MRQDFPQLRLEHEVAEVLIALPVAVEFLSRGAEQLLLIDTLHFVFAAKLQAGEVKLGAKLFPVFEICCIQF